jgi:hypothetical protein
MVSNPLGVKLLNLLHINEFEISAPHYSPAGNGDMLDIAVDMDTRLSETVGSHILDSDHLPIFLHLLYNIITRSLSDQLTTSQIGSGLQP